MTTSDGQGSTQPADDSDRLDGYLALITAERECRPSEALLADEIHRLRAERDEACGLGDALASALDFLVRADHYNTTDEGTAALREWREWQDARQ